MKIFWQQVGFNTTETTLNFGFNAVPDLMDGKLNVDWLNPGTKLGYTHNLCMVPGIQHRPGPVAIPPALHKGKISGGSGRCVYPIINDPAYSFRAGLTVHKTLGTWSSLPHEFEKVEILEPRPMPFFEKFAYITDPGGGWGIQTRIGHLFGGRGNSNITFEDGESWFCNDIQIIRDRDIMNIPLGSHPVTAGPGIRLAYIWAYWTTGSNPWVMALREKF
jgi:hypothetical protein